MSIQLDTVYCMNLDTPYWEVRMHMAANQTRNNNSIRSILDKEKLNGSNFLDWYRNPRIVLRNEQKLHHLEEALPEAPPATVTDAFRNSYIRRVSEQQEIACRMLTEQELTKTVKAFHDCKQEEGQSVSTYVLKMKAYLDQIDHLGYPMPLVLGVNLILTSLSKDHDKFLQNYNMHGIGNIIPELHAMLKLTEKGIPKKAPDVLAIRQCQIQKPKLQARGNGKNKGKGKKLKKNKANMSSTTVSKDSVLYFNAIPRDGIFESDMHKHVSNERSIYTCSNKKSKHNLYSTFLWHCRLGYINKKRTAKLQHDGLLKSIDDESFDVCVSCISGKMAIKPFTHASERDDDLLGLIHSDVCGSFRTTSKEGANYYVTFTDEFKNKLGKTIKALRSDRGGEYLSQEFLDHLKSHRIVSQLTIP
ncbi:retrotransposon protein, putative, ty1-copia subclass [Tanacetum coccineum]